MSDHCYFYEPQAKILPSSQSRVKTEAIALCREGVLSQILQQVGFMKKEVARWLGISQSTYARCDDDNNMRCEILQKIVLPLVGELSFHVSFDSKGYCLSMEQ